MHPLRNPVILLGAMGFLCTCGERADRTAAPPERAERTAIRAWSMSRPMAGTEFSVRLYTDLPASDVEQALARAFDAAAALEKILSCRDAESELNRLNNAPHGIPCPISEPLACALRLALRLARETDGAYDPTLGPCIRLWHRARSRGELPSGTELAQALSASGHAKLRLDERSATKLAPGMRIDLGGIGKGIMLDAMAAELRRSGITRYLLTDTSDLLAGDAPPGKTAWEYTSPSGRSIPLLNEAASTSGGGRQHTVIEGKSYAHIIDSRTGLGIRADIPPSTVHAPTAAEADALATAAAVHASRSTPPQSAAKEACQAR